MLSKITVLKILLLILFVFTFGVVWFFVSITSKNSMQKVTEVVYISSSSKAISSSSKAKSSLISSNFSSMSNSDSSILNSSSMESSLVSSVVSSVLENNLDLINEVKLIIEKPNPEIQEVIKSAKNRPKVEVKNSMSQSSFSVID